MGSFKIEGTVNRRGLKLQGSLYFQSPMGGLKTEGALYFKPLSQTLNIHLI